MASPISKARRSHAKKPHPDYPLFRHQNGQWAKKVKGKLHYFGIDADAALAKWLDQRDDLLAGRKPRSTKDGLSVAELCDRFLSSKKVLLDAGELSPLTWRDYYICCETLVTALGKARAVADLGSDDFEKFRASLAQHCGPSRLAVEIQRVRTIFKYAFDEILIDKPVRFGTTFRKPNRKIVRKARQASGGKMIEAAELRRILGAARQPLRAMILLGINCGFGQSDVAGLPVAAVDLAGGWIDYPRPKTAVLRRCPLWPETVVAMREAIADRPAATDKADAGAAFITRFGHRYVRTNDRQARGAVAVDSVAPQFAQLLQSLELKRAGSFYNLRHTFRTVADAVKDQPAIDAIMGHTSEGMAAHYRERIEDSRLRAVADAVRAWLWPKRKPAGIA